MADTAVALEVVTIAVCGAATALAGTRPTATALLARDFARVAVADASARCAPEVRNSTASSDTSGVYATHLYLKRIIRLNTELCVDIRL
ncbi:MAG: hypothetical protein WBG17_06350 [Burkholderiaceae bacterium]